MKVTFFGYSKINRASTVHCTIGTLARKKEREEAHFYWEPLSSTRALSNIISMIPTVALEGRSWTLCTHQEKEAQRSYMIWLGSTICWGTKQRSCSVCKCVNWHPEVPDPEEVIHDDMNCGLEQQLWSKTDLDSNLSSVTPSSAIWQKLG